MQEIMIPIIVLSALGLFFGIVLSVASKIFEVKKDPKVELVKQILPGANCGGCGFPGCDGFSEAVVKGTAKPDGCPVGGPQVAQGIGQILGIKVAEGIKLDAKVLCQGNEENCQRKFEYEGVKDCLEASVAAGGGKSCSFGCLGYGSCVSVCKFNALHINELGIAEVDSKKCTGCGMCADICPRHIIKLVPQNRNVHVFCNTRQKNKDIKNTCRTGCIRCGICVKSCPFDAIQFNPQTALPEIDPKRCRECMVCVDKCPRNCIVSERKEHLKARINPDKCIGCTICSKNCVADAIQGELKKLHTVNQSKCIGCRICAEKCPKGAIDMI